MAERNGLRVAWGSGGANSFRDLDAQIVIQGAACALTGEDTANRHGVLRVSRSRDSNMAISDRMTMRVVEAPPPGTREIDFRPRV